MRVVLPVAALVVAAFILRQWLKAPFWERNAALLTPIVSLRYGYPLYFREGIGPVLPMVYGPVMAFVYGTVAFLKNPTSIVIAGSVLATLWYFLPMAALIRRLSFFLAFCFLTFESDPLRYSAFRTAADAPALGLGLLSGMFLLSRWRYRLWGSALLLSLAIWCKQVTLFIAPGLVLYLFLAHGKREALRFGLIFGSVLTIVSVSFIQFFDPQAIGFYMFKMPMSQPWIAGPGETLLSAIFRFTQEVLWPGIALGLIGAFLLTNGPPQNLQADVRRHPWILWVFVSLCMITATLLTRARIGGDVNSFSYTLYFVMAALWTAARQAAEPTTSTVSTGTRLFALLVLLAGITLHGPPLLYLRFSQLWHALPENPDEQAFRYARARPEETYFPWNPLATLLADKKLYHFEYGLFERALDGFAVSPQLFQTHLPAKMQRIAFHKDNEFNHELTQLYLPQFSQAAQDPALKDWNVFTRTRKR